MIIPKFTFAKRSFCVLLITFYTITALSQVGIGNINPDPSSMLDISSTTQGILTPRMTTAQRLAITNPANGLMVYDLDARTFYFYETNATAWISLNSSRDKRNNFVLVKSLADLPAPVGEVITLLSDHYYEINGTIFLGTNTINLNNAYLSGLDANEDRLLKTSGAIFTGSTGGSIRNVTLLGGTIAGSGTGTAFSIASTADQNLLLQNAIIANMASVGTVSGLGLFFSNIVQYVGNKNGITYNDITNLLLSNQGWFAGNAGTYETLTGTFALVQKVSGFSTVNAGATAINVNGSPIVTEGVILNTLFTGAGTYVNRYPSANTGYNFNNNWVINSPGIPRESDNEATGNIYYNGTITTGFVQTVSNNNEFNLSGNLNSNTTTAVNIFRSSSPQNNRITYLGKRKRTFQISASLSVRGNTTTGEFYAFFIKKIGATNTTLTETNTIMRVNNTSDISSNAISGTVELSPGESIEIWGQRLVGSGTSTITVFSLNLNIK